MGALAIGCASGCTSADMALFAEALAEYDSQSQAQYLGQQATYHSAPLNSSYTPYTFNAYGGWPNGVSHGDWVGYGQCRHIGSFYTCDTDGDGFADMYGNSETGSFSSAYLRVNGVGEAYGWDDDCACWEREPAYDGETAYRGPRDHRKRYDDDDHYDDN